MKIMLAAVNSKYIHSNLAVYSLYRYAQVYRDDLVLREYTINQSKDEILKGIYKEKPEVLCFSCYIWNISLVRELAAELHKILPDTQIWFGGPEVSFDAARIMDELSYLTGIMRGEGEQTFFELARYYVKKQGELSEIAGITWRLEEGRIQENSDRKIMDLSEIPFPYDDLEDFENRIIYYESSRGCPFSCSYCLSSVDKRVRFRALSLVEQELQFFLDHKVKQIKFVDRTFNCNHEHAMGIWSYLNGHDNGITNFHFEISSDLLTAEEIALLNAMRPGLVQLEIGVQSVNPQTLKAICRTMSFDKVSQNVRAVTAGGNIHQHLDLIAGLPYEDYNSFGDSFNAVYNLQPEQLQLGFLKVLKGSNMAEQAPEYGCLYQSREPYEVLQTRWLSYDEVLKLKQLEDMVEVYYNSGQFEKTVKAVEGLFSSPFEFFEKLGAFYEANGYFGVSHTRMRRYDILLEFLLEVPGSHIPYYQELMLFDLYARENLKKRPDWASDQASYKQQIKSFYRRERDSYQYLQGYEDYDERQMSKMTHLELFHYDFQCDKPVWQEQARMVLFDYRNRDPLTNSARTVMIQPKETKWQKE